MGYAKEKAVAWHKARHSARIPETVDEALGLHYQQPTRILIRPEGKYWRVLQYDYRSPDDGVVEAGRAVQVEKTREEIELEEYEIPF